MKTCDRCHQATPSLIQLTDEFETLEACQTCYEKLNAAILAVNLENNERHKKLRNAAFIVWKGEPSNAPTTQAKRPWWRFWR